VGGGAAGRYSAPMALEDELAKLTKRAARKGGQRRGMGVLGGVLLIGGGLVALICLIIVASGFARTGPNEVGVVYNGGPLDKKTQRQLIAPSSGLTWTGWLSQDPRLYPSEGSPRRYLITSEGGGGDRPGVDAVRVPTADGIDVGLEAKISFTTAFTGAPDDDLMKSFDARFGNRTFASFDGRRLHPWEGDDGFAAFLDTEFRPVSSCALIGRSRNVLVDSEAGSQTNANLLKVQDAVATALDNDLERNLGAPYFSNVQIIVSAVRLPERVQQAVNEAQAQFAEVNKSKADLQKARIAKQVNDTLGRSYSNCPACAQIDALKAIPSNVTAISLGGNGSVALSGK
jgi:hypothetical protein